jgi:RNA polymerase sigma-70 factor (ECF subfamily)
MAEALLVGWRGAPTPARSRRVAELVGEPPRSAPREVLASGFRLGRRRGMETNLAHLSDEALVGLIARSDDDALAELYDRYGRVAYGLALRILRNRALAEDAVQEGFLAAWRSAARFSADRAKPSTWLLTLVHRRAVDLVRREERRRTEPIEVAPQETGEATHEEAAVREQRRAVRDALSRLSDDQREALELAYYGGFTQAELAARLGVPLGTIKSRMFTGLSRLRDLLGESGFEPLAR